jgi:hypothetical protein
VVGAASETCACRLAVGMPAQGLVMLSRHAQHTDRSYSRCWTSLQVQDIVGKSAWLPCNCDRQQLVAPNGGLTLNSQAHDLNCQAVTHMHGCQGVQAPNVEGQDCKVAPLNRLRKVGIPATLQFWRVTQDLTSWGSKSAWDS